MRRLRRWAGYTLATLIGVVLLAALSVAGLLWRTLPGGDLRAAIPGLSQPVAIAIDTDGVPVIQARTETDAAAALGFLHARERLFQMELMRRAAAGRLSEIAGPATLANDRLMRTLGVARAARADLDSLAPDTRAVLDAYAAGVNAWIARRGRFAAAEFLLLGAPEPWQPADSLLWAKTMGLYLSANWRTEMARGAMLRSDPQADPLALWPASGGPGRPEAALDIPGLAPKLARLAGLIPHFPAPFTLPASASNEWAVDASRSTTGAPLLAGDPHLGFSLPGIWYLARIELPGRVLAGATAPGVPFLVIGRNSAIAWTFTTTGADVQDLFVETPAGDGYATPAGPAAFRIRQERIAVRGQPAQLLTVRETRHGPVISDLAGTDGPPVALAMANLAPGDTAADGLLALNRAGSVAQAGEAAARITSPVQNMLVADRAGIGFFLTGRVPLRRTGDGAVPSPGADGTHDWTGWAAGDRLPHILAPASFRLVNANERPAPPDFPVFLGRDWFGDWRARRIRELLDARPKHDTASFAAMQADAVSVFARDLLPRLRATPVPPGLPARAQALLADWDGAMAMDLPQPLIFETWMRRFHAALLARRNAPAGALPPAIDVVAHALTHSGATWCGGDCTPLLATALDQATQDLRPQGDDPAAWRWGRAHQAVFAHPLLRFVPLLGDLTTLRIPVPGSDSTVNRAGGPGPDSVHGAGYRGVYDLADLDASRFIVTPGQSGHVLSRLARNLAEKWRDGATLTLGPAPPTPDVRLYLDPGAAP